MSDQFTPGPWQCVCGIIHAAGKGVRAGKVAEVSIAFKDSKTRDANANLIASAPELYEALRTLVSEHIKRGPFDEPIGQSEQEPEINAACEALAKARGEQSVMGRAP